MGWVHPRDSVSRGTHSAQQHRWTQSNQHLGGSLGWQGWTCQPGPSHHLMRDQSSPSTSTWRGPRDGDGCCRAEVEYVLLEPWRAVSTHKTLAELSPGSGCLSTAHRAVYSWQRHFSVIVFFTLSVFLNNTDKKPGWWQKVAGRMEPSKAKQPLRHAYSPMGNKMSFIL